MVWMESATCRGLIQVAAIGSERSQIVGILDKGVAGKFKAVIATVGNNRVSIGSGNGQVLVPRSVLPHLASQFQCIMNKICFPNP